MADAGSDLKQHPAYLRWRESGYGGPVPTSVRRFRTLPGSSEVYLLEGVGQGEKSAIAKRARAELIAREALVLERLLPEIGLPSARCLGTVEEPEGTHAWLFMEYVGGREPAWTSEDRAAAARWLATLHSVSSGMNLGNVLPAVDAQRYQGYLTSTRERLMASRGNPRLEDHSVALDRLLDLCAEIESGWADVESCMARLPSALMHGDFIPKNIRLVGAEPSTRFMVLDWESAGWGPPVEDISFVDLEAYRAAINGDWARRCSDVLDEMHAIGEVFRLIAWIQGETAGLSSKWVAECVMNLADYEEQLLLAWTKMRST